MRIYIAGPYSSDPEGNTRRAMAAGVALLELGHFPFIPHISHFVDLVFGPLSRDLYLKWDMEFLKLCDAMLYLGSSPGADLELEQAQRLGMPVFNSIADISRADHTKVMTPDQEAHLARLGYIFIQRLDAKYRAGQKEHGGDLFRKEHLLEEAILEAIDQYVYVQTEIDRRNLQDHPDHTFHS